ncbi:MAG: phosphopentomutase [Armatimonadota bacterium]|nr:phosphopentomutase [bacterium]
MINRGVLIVLDSVGAGALPDADEYGDAGSNTLSHVADSVGGLHLPNLEQMGLGNIIQIAGVPPADHPTACYGRMAEVSKGKDTTTGHWEMMGIITEHPFPVYPHGFPDNVMEKFESTIGRKTLGNKAASGTEIIKELGEEHIRTGYPIVYTSADSVFQIACHEDVIPIDELYRMCQIAREMLVPPHNVQRVIARPFTGSPGNFTRTERRRDFALEPPVETLLDTIAVCCGEVIGIGKIEDVYAGRGITSAIHTGNNKEGIAATIAAIIGDEGNLIFTNLVDFDMLYGHRNDSHGYAAALEEFDVALPVILDVLKKEDLLIITADHGCDPTTQSTDHSREYVPLLVYGKDISQGINLGVRSCFCDIAATLAQILGYSYSLPGHSFAADIS